jgi:predicted nucleic acid-binding protein
MGSQVGSGLITLDTSALLPLLARRDPAHDQVRALVTSRRGPYLVPAAILAEVDYLIRRRAGRRGLTIFLDDLVSGALAYDCGDRDLSRVRELVQRYEDLPLSVADASVVACAERSGGTVVALDRDFTVVAKEGTITVLPEQGQSFSTGA